mgnify:CR=1 FL=1
MTTILFRTPFFVGLQNYVDILSDPLIVKAFVQTFKYAFVTVPLELIFALFIAYILNFKIKGVKFFPYGILYSLYPGRFGIHRGALALFVPDRRSGEYGPCVYLEWNR